MAVLELIRTDGARVQCDTIKQSITYLKRTVSFTGTEWLLLKVLYFELGHPIPRKRLMSCLPKEEHRGNSRVLDMHISQIRAKLQKIKVARIQSVYRVGYILLPSYKK